MPPQLVVVTEFDDPALFQKHMSSRTVFAGQLLILADAPLPEQTVIFKSKNNKNIIALGKVVEASPWDGSFNAEVTEFYT